LAYSLEAGGATGPIRAQLRQIALNLPVKLGRSSLKGFMIPPFGTPVTYGI
jgi:hypothetical protein